MRMKFLDYVLATLAVLATVTPLQSQEVTPVPLSATTSGANLRRMALKSLRPTYPEDALQKAKTGVAVAEVHISVEGVVTHVDVLEAPSASIGKSVETTLSQWRFPQGSSGEGPVTMSGKLVFYFEIKDGKGVVLFPAETGYVGRWHDSFARASAGSRNHATTTK